MTAFWAEIFMLSVFATYIVVAIWYLARPMEDDNEQQQHRPR
jgi:hypothetical protein